MTQRDPMDYAWWLASRASGVVALVLVSLAVGLGLAMAGRLPNRPALRKAMVAAHEHAALVGLVAIAVHAITLLGDHWLHPGPAGVLVPFVMDHEPPFTAMGIVGGWLAALLGLSFYVRRRIGPALWRKLHRLTALVWLLAVGHALGAGTDAGSVWLQAIIVATGAPIVFLLIARHLPREKPVRRPVAAAEAASGTPPSSSSAAASPPSAAPRRCAPRATTARSPWSAASPTRRTTARRSPRPCWPGPSPRTPPRCAPTAGTPSRASRSSSAIPPSRSSRAACCPTAGC